MRKVRFYRLLVILILAIMLVAAILFVLSWWRQDDTQPPQRQEEGLELPLLPLIPQDMTDAQRQAAIDLAAKDAFDAARASGQSEDRAQIAAQHARTQAHSIFYPSQP